MFFIFFNVIIIENNIFIVFNHQLGLQDRATFAIRFNVRVGEFCVLYINFVLRILGIKTSLRVLKTFFFSYHHQCASSPVTVSLKK
jgi:hypothetical protein